MRPILQGMRGGTMVLAAAAFGALASTPAFSQGVVCAQNIRALSGWENCTSFCPGEAGMQLFQCSKPSGAMSYTVDGYLVRRANGSHYTINRGTGARLSGDYVHACDALIATCQ